MEADNSRLLVSEHLRGRAFLLLEIVLIFWIVELVNLVLGHRLCALGIRPRTVIGLLGILFSPFLHGGVMHLALNTVPFIVLGGLVVARGARQFLELSLFIVLVGGGAVWLFGRSGTVHVGASGLIFGYFGFLVARGWYERTLGSILIALLTVALYGGILVAVLPIYEYVSWQGHLFGLIAGAIAARLEFLSGPANA